MGERRRLPIRWLTMAEVVGLAALAVAVLGYLDNHRERTQADRDRAAAAREHQAQARAGALRQTFLLTAEPTGDGDRLRLAPARPEQVIQTQTLTFPAEVRQDTADTTGNRPQFESGWLDGLPHALRAHGDKRTRGRVPVAVVTVFIEDGETRTDRSIYLVGYALHPRVLRSDRVELEGLSLLLRGVGEDVKAAVEAAWAREVGPAKG